MPDREMDGECSLAQRCIEAGSSAPDLALPAHEMCVLTEELPEWGEFGLTLYL